MLTDHLQQLLLLLYNTTLRTFIRPSVWPIRAVALQRSMIVLLQKDCEAQQ